MVTIQPRPSTYMVKYIEQVPGMLDAIRWAHDKLGLQEEEQDFNLQLALEKKQQQKAFPWKQQKQLQPPASAEDETKLSQLFKQEPQIVNPNLHQIQHANPGGEVADALQVPGMNKQSLLFLAMKSKHQQEKNTHAFNMSLLNAIQSL